MPELPLSLAVALAGQVAIGLAPGDDQDERMQGALEVIGLMLWNQDSDGLVKETLSMAERTRITRTRDGGWLIEPEP